MSENYLRGVLGWLGPRGYSAYEIYVQTTTDNPVKSEADWLATLGTASYFSEDKEIYTSTSGQTVFDIPSEYTANSFIDVYVNGMRLNSNEYSINLTTMKITLTSALAAGAKVEIVVLTMSTNNLPIVTAINASSTDTEVPSAKAVHDYVETEIADVPSELIDDVTTSNTKVYSSNKVNSIKAALEASIATKVNKSNIQVLTGSIADIAPGATVTVDIPYPTGFAKASTIIMGKMVSSNSVYYDVADIEMTANGFPTISMTALADDYIRVWLKNTNQTQTRNGHYKITLMNVG